MSLNPIWAVLGDFGKALRAKTDQNISIGPAITRAPEVDGTTRYDNKIDVWSMGWAFMWVYMPNLLLEKSQPFNLYAWHEKVMGVLTSTLVEDGWYARLAELLTGMLALDPVKRISAAQALSQVYSLLASPPPQQAYLPLPQVSSQQKPSSEHSSELSQRDSRLDPGGCPFTITELVQEESVEASDKRARLL
ncbi:MAG: hypothetical protein Q9188_002551 [Gyalolechia gomerana]